MNKNLILFIIGFSIVIVLAGTYYIGAAVSCNNSGGELINWITNFKCSEVEIIKACEFEDKLYTFKEGQTPIINLENVN